MVKGGASSELPVFKQIILFSLAVFSVTVPTFFGKISFFKNNDPAMLSVFIGFITAVFSYFILKLFFTELTVGTINSTAAILGLVTAHVSVYEISDKIPPVPVYMLFVFLFYYHFDESGVMRFSTSHPKVE